MGDNESVSSDWESVRDEDAAQWGAERIVLELPSEGLRGDGAVEVGVSATAAAAADGGSHCSRSVSGSSISSFVPVSRFDKMSVQPRVEVMMPGEKAKAAGLAGIDNSEDETGSSISSFANVSEYDTTSEKYQYKSEASSHAVDDDSLLGNFEVLSLSSGEVVLRCKRCTFHNKPGAAVCAVCQLALVANPNIDIDAQIAAHLLQKEEQPRAPFYDHACILTQDINGAYCNRLHTLPDEDSRNLASKFIKQVVDFPDPKRILLALKCTSHDSLEGIRAGGFSADQPFMDPRQVEISHYLSNAIDSFEMMQMMRGEPLGSIPENPDDGAENQRVPNCLCWIVAIVLGTTDDCNENMNTCWPPEQTFPVAYFESSCKTSRDGLPAMLDSLNDTLVDGFFAKNLNLEVRMRTPPSPGPSVQWPRGRKPWESIMAKRQTEEEERARARIAERIPKRKRETDTDNVSDDTDHAAAMGNDEYHSLLQCLQTKNRQSSEGEPADLLVEGEPFSWDTPKDKIYDDNVKEGCLLLEQQVELEHELGTSTAKSLIANKTDQADLLVGGEPFSWDTKDKPNDKIYDNNVKEGHELGMPIAKSLTANKPDQVTGHEVKEVKPDKLHRSISALAPFKNGLICCSGRDICLLDKNLVVYKTLKSDCRGGVLCITSASFGEKHLIASGTGLGVVSVHDYEEDDGSHTCRFGTNLGGCCASILSVRILPKVTSVAAVNRYRECYLFDIAKKTCIVKLRGEQTAPRGTYPGPCLSVAEFSPDGYRLASVVEGGDSIHFWHLSDGKTQQLTGHESSVDIVGRPECFIRALSFSTCGKFLASTAKDCTIRIWDVQKDDVQCVQVINVPDALSSLAFSSDLVFIAGGSVTGMVTAWNFSPDDQGSVVPVVGMRFSNKGSIKLIAFLPDSKSLVWTGWTSSSFRHCPLIDMDANANCATDRNSV